MDSGLRRRLRPEHRGPQVSLRGEEPRASWANRFVLPADFLWETATWWVRARLTVLKKEKSFFVLVEYCLAGFFFSFFPPFPCSFHQEIGDGDAN